jgi:hypothetical protein
MTVRQFQIAFQDAFERANLTLDITSTELFREINEAQDDIIDELYLRFEQNNMISAALSPLVMRNTEILTDYAAEISLDNYSIDRVTLPTNFRYLIALRAEVEWMYGGYSGTTVDVDGNRTVDDVEKTTKIVPVRIVMQDHLHQILKDPFNKSIFRSPVAIRHDDAIDIYCDTSTYVAPKAYLDYVKKPATIALPSTSSELPDYVHRDIVDRAVAQFLSRSGNVSQTNKQTEQ